MYTYSNLINEKEPIFTYEIKFRKAMRSDRMAIPPVGWRVPYVIVYGEPGRPLIHSVRKPDEVIFEVSGERNYSQQISDQQISVNGTLRPNDTYYIMKVIAPVLARCLSLLGVDVVHWYSELPKIGKALSYFGHSNLNPSITVRRYNTRIAPQQGIITNYFVNMRCIGCENIMPNNNKSEQLCPTCVLNPQKTILNLHKKIHMSDKRKQELRRICLSCANNTIRCQSLDCPVIYSRFKAESEMNVILNVTEVLPKVF